jgi:S-adenosylmethionine:tRNA ribosyltransferase-isomerase
MRALHPGCWVDADEAQVLIGARIADGRVEVTLHVDPETSVETCLANIGRVPIPPYLGRDDELSDVSRYQTVFAERIGSVAAPTAGLHLTNAALARLASRGISVGKVTLHVGLGTFRPVSVDDLDAHPMHSEVFEVSETLASQVASTRAKGGVVVAVGTTVIRALESASDSNQRGYVRAQTGRTRLLIQPGYRFSVVDALLTNFHQPKSTLLALVAAAIGTSTMKEAYDHALRHGYRFLSYGDAMWIPECSR